MKLYIQDLHIIIHLTCLIRFDDNARRIIIRPILLLETECTCIFITIISHQLIL
ncbi:Uncharacterised protein [Segatella copri]|nr:Uncharacterised protein [Segatella copri]